MTFIHAIGDVRDGIDPDLAQGPREDGEAGQPVGIEITEHEYSLASLTGPFDPADETIRVREESRVVESGFGRAKKRSSVSPSVMPRPTMSSIARGPSP